MLQRLLALALTTTALTVLLTAPADAAILKRVQTGTQAITNGTLVNVTLGYPVASTSSAFVLCSQRTTANSSTQANRVTCNLASTTQVAIDGGTTIANGVTVDWTVVEFSEGVTVTRNQTTLNSGTTASNPAVVVDCTKSFVILAGAQTSSTANTARDQQNLFRAYLASDSGTTVCTTGNSATLRLERGDATNDTTIVGWQVVTYEGASVQRVNGASIAANATSVTPAAFTAVDTTKSLLLFTYSTVSGAAGNEGLWATRGNFATYGSSVTTATFTRAAQNNVNAITIAYEVVTFNDGTTLQHNTSISGDAFAAGNTTVAPTIASVDRTAAVPFSSTSGGSSGTATNFENVAASAQITGTTTLTFTRGEAAGTTTTVNWSVVSFYRCKDSAMCHVGVKALPTSMVVTWSPIYDITTAASSCASTANDRCHALVVIAQLDAGDITFTPVTNVTYTAGNLTSGAACTFTSGNPTAGTPCVVSAGTGTGTPVQTATQTGLQTGKRYVVKVFPRIVYSPIASASYVTNLSNSISEVAATTPSGSQAWTYAATGGASLNAPIIAGSNRVYLTSNGNKVTGLDTTGAELGTPIVTNGTPQGILTWFPVSPSGASIGVIGTDDKGWVYSFNGATGALNWRKQLDSSNTQSGQIRPSVAIQINMYSDWGPGYTLPATYPITLTLSALSGTLTVTADAPVFRSTDVGKQLASGPGTATITSFTSSTQVSVGVVSNFDALPTHPFDTTGLTRDPYTWSMTVTSFQATYNSATYGNYTGDVLFVTTRGGGTVNNKVFALRATDGTTLWTFSPQASGLGGMDQVDSEPAVDYTRNRLYVTSQDGQFGGQGVFWVLDTTNTQVASPSMYVDQYFDTVDVLGSPNTSYDGFTTYFSANDGTLAAENLGPISQNGNVLKWVYNALGGVGVGEVKGFPWEDYYAFGRLYFVTLDGNMHCLQDNGSSAGKCGVSPDTGSAWTTNPRKPVAGGAGTAAQPLLLDYLFLAGSDGLLYQINTSTGATVSTFTLESGTTLGDLSTDPDGATTLYVGTTGGRVYRYNLTGGQL